jgi:biopolymer transport protein ExbD
MSRRRERGRFGGGAGTLNLTPMIDVVFQLLIYFVLGLSLEMDEELIRTELPRREAGAGLVIDDEPAVVEVAAAEAGTLPMRVRGPISFSASTPAELRMRVREAIAGPAPTLAPSQRFVLKPLPGATWDDAVEAFNALAAAGATRISFWREAAP